MKELSTEEKAKAYDEAIKVIHKYEGANIMFSQSLKEEMFPELKESDDERLRKGLLSHLRELREYKGTNPPIKKAEHYSAWIAWLEKKDKQKFVWTKQDERGLEDALWCCKQAASIAKDENDMGNAWFAENWLKSLKARFVLEQGKQKPADEVEQKFREGDWVVQKDLGVYKIIEVCESWYEVILCKDGIQYSIGFDKEKDCHLWSLQDAKDGDVLASSVGAFIYNGRNDGSSCPGSYCGINTLGQFKICDTNHWTGKKVYPATKEQREFLFTKMKEAGYEWDAEKKGLTGCLQKESLNKDLEAELREYLNSDEYINSIGTSGLLKIACHFADWQHKKDLLCEQKSVWTEEDEKMYSRIYDLIHESAFLNYDVDEDGKELGEYAKIINWFKSLKPQSHWKPSEVQMKELKNVFDPNTDSWDEDILQSLYSDLQKL